MGEHTKKVVRFIVLHCSTKDDDGEEDNAVGILAQEKARMAPKKIKIKSEWHRLALANSG